ncbi:hypothetical protein Glove_346g72 [Diversispora epigaea]|uniref:Uncharacterized protein n=1 Tax=Diversispora epigaea TaxID=1348612 RepID=A0A397HJT8_9GLOM|nr:hypothetical protein Glove_346g72 [Diversispora epigaea]
MSNIKEYEPKYDYPKQIYIYIFFCMVKMMIILRFYVVYFYKSKINNSQRFGFDLKPNNNYPKPILFGF